MSTGLPYPTPLTERMASYWCRRMIAAGYTSQHTAGVAGVSTMPIRKDGRPTGKWLIVLQREHKEHVYIDNRELAKSYIADRGDR